MKCCVLCGILGDGQSSESKYPSFNLPSSEPFSTGFIVSLFFLCFTTLQLPTTVYIVFIVRVRVRGGSTYGLICVLRYVHSALLGGGHKTVTVCSFRMCNWCPAQI